MKLITSILPKESFDLLKRIQYIKDFDDFYLAGGTALALQLGHRMSYDFDFFSQKEFSSVLIKSIGKPYEILSLQDNSIELIKNNCKIMYMYFAFPLFKPILKINSIRLADPIDIGLMKLLALQGRSSRKDIIDLFFIHKEIIELSKLLKIFENHYPKESFNSYKSLKTLINRDSFEHEPMPMMLKKCKWEDALKGVESSVAKHIRAQL